MTTTHPTRIPKHGANRRGIAGVWLVLSIPLFVAVLGFVLNIGFLWIAEANLENAAASGALAGVKVLSKRHRRDDGNQQSQHPGQNGNGARDQQAVAVAEAFIKANCVNGRRIALQGNSKKRATPRSRCRSVILLGTVVGRTFRASPPGSGRRHNACYVQLICQVEGPLGWLTGPKKLRTSATAVIGPDGRPRLVEIDRVQRTD